MRLSPNVQKLRPSQTIAVSTLARRLAAEGRDVIDLSAGQPDFDTPEHVSDGGIEGIRQGGTRYTPVAGLPALRGAIAKDHSRFALSDLDPAGVVVSSGAKQSIFNACFTLFGPGDEVLIGAPYWTSYPEIITLARATPVPVAGPAETGFKLNPEVLDATATRNTRGLLFSTPSNPSGAVYTAEELAAVAEWARSRDIWVISDEIYQRIHFAAAGPAAGLLSLPEGAVGPSVVINGASKSFAMTGWRIGFSYSTGELAAKMSAVQSHMTSNAATPSQLAALAAYSQSGKTDAAVAEMVAAFRRRRDLVVARLREGMPSADFVQPDGAFYLFFQIDGAFTPEAPDSVTLCSKLLEETGVALVPGAAFGDDRYARLSFATSDDLLETAFDRMTAFLAPSMVG